LATELLLGKAPSWDLGPYSPERLGRALPATSVAENGARRPIP
jgi:hypothetical protein